MRSAMSPIVADLPSPHVYGEAVLAQIFARTPPDTVEVFWLDAAPLPPMKLLFRSLDGATVIVERIRRFVLNCDYWVMVPPSRVTSLRSDLPPEKQLTIVGKPDDADTLRILHLVRSYPWEKVTFDVQALREAAYALTIRDHDAADLVAMKLGYRSAADLLARGQN